MEEHKTNIYNIFRNDLYDITRDITQYYTNYEIENMDEKQEIEMILENRYRFAQTKYQDQILTYFDDEIVENMYLEESEKLFKDESGFLDFFKRRFLDELYYHKINLQPRKESYNDKFYKVMTRVSSLPEYTMPDYTLEDLVYSLVDEKYEEKYEEDFHSLIFPNFDYIQKFNEAKEQTVVEDLFQYFDEFYLPDNMNLERIEKNMKMIHKKYKDRKIREKSFPYITELLSREHNIEPGFFKKNIGKFIFK